MEYKHGPHGLTYSEMLDIRARRFYAFGIGAESFERPNRLLTEGGVNYTHELHTARAYGFARMFYHWQHASGAAGCSVVFCNPGDLLTLLDRWNGQASLFKYWRDL